jgi:hypothetical protein
LNLYNTFYLFTKNKMPVFADALPMPEPRFYPDPYNPGLDNL